MKRFVDPQPEFIFLPRDTDWAGLRDGVVYDVPGCDLGHHGEEVSFDAILNRYDLRDSARRLHAEIVRAADFTPSRPHSAGEGLQWIAHGFSVLWFSDPELLEREFPLYDALYAGCQRQMGQR